MRISDWSSDVCSSDLARRKNEVTTAQKVQESYERIVVNPIAGSLGAEIEAIDLSQGLDNQTQDEIHRALLEHHVIFFRDQTMMPQDLATLARKFGRSEEHTSELRSLLRLSYAGFCLTKT